MYLVLSFGLKLYENICFTTNWSMLWLDCNKFVLTSVSFIMSNIDLEKSIFQKQTDNTCIKLLKITQLCVLMSDELVFHFAKYVRNSYLNVWHFIYWKKSYLIKHKLNLDWDSRKKKGSPFVNFLFLSLPLRINEGWFVSLHVYGCRYVYFWPKDSVL